MTLKKRTIHPPTGFQLYEVLTEPTNYVINLNKYYHWHLNGQVTNNIGNSMQINETPPSMFNTSSWDNIGFTRNEIVLVSVKLSNKNMTSFE